ncbi:MAG TPA: hypothetical protein VMD53_00340 [Rhizomicrobium sp.]|nr:hypothetical protein [Rhizomicrobium sp.]
MSWKTSIARRPLLASLAGLLGVAAAGGLVYEGGHVFGRRYPRTKFDDLLDQLGDRESAARLGRAAIAQMESHTDVVPRFDVKVVARELRDGPGKGSVARAAEADIAQARLLEVQGWVLPRSLVAVALIAAEMSGTNG